MCQWPEILSALSEISDDICEKSSTRAETKGIYKFFNCLESCLIAIFWNNILARFNTVNKILQSPNTELSTVVELYQSLIQFVRDMRESFSLYEMKAIDKCGINSYRRDTSRQRKRKVFFDERTDNDEASLSRSDDFRINIFYTILDSFCINLERRSQSYVNLNNRFGFLSKLHTMQLEVIAEKARELRSYYPVDLEDTLDIECQHLTAHLRAVNTVKISESDLCKFLREKLLVTLYLNINIALSMYLCMMVSNCSGERSFSVLRRVKNYLRTTQGNNRLNALALLCIEAELCNLMYNV